MTTFTIPEPHEGPAYSYLERAKIVLERMSFIGQRAYVDTYITWFSTPRRRVHGPEEYSAADKVRILSTLRRWQSELEEARSVA